MTSGGKSGPPARRRTRIALEVAPIIGAVGFAALAVAAVVGPTTAQLGASPTPVASAAAIVDGQPGPSEVAESATPSVTVVSKPSNRSRHSSAPSAVPTVSAAVDAHSHAQVPRRAHGRALPFGPRRPKVAGPPHHASAAVIDTPAVADRPVAVVAESPAVPPAAAPAVSAGPAVAPPGRNVIPTITPKVRVARTPPPAAPPPASKPPAAAGPTPPREHSETRATQDNQPRSADGSEPAPSKAEASKAETSKAEAGQRGDRETKTKSKSQRNEGGKDKRR